MSLGKTLLKHLKHVFLHQQFYQPTVAGMQIIIVWRMKSMNGYLDSSFSQINSHCQVLSHKYVWIVSLWKCSFQLLQLIACESCSESPLLTFWWFAFAVRSIFVRKQVCFTWSIALYAASIRWFGAIFPWAIAWPAVCHIDFIAQLSWRFLHSDWHCWREIRSWIKIQV